MFERLFDDNLIENYDDNIIENYEVNISASGCKLKNFSILLPTVMKIFDYQLLYCTCPMLKAEYLSKQHLYYVCVLKLFDLQCVRFELQHFIAF